MCAAAEAEASWRGLAAQAGAAAAGGRRRVGGGGVCGYGGGRSGGGGLAATGVAEAGWRQRRARRRAKRRRPIARDGGEAGRARPTGDARKEPEAAEMGRRLHDAAATRRRWACTR